MKAEHYNLLCKYRNDINLLLENYPNDEQLKNLKKMIIKELMSVKIDEEGFNNLRKKYDQLKMNDQIPSLKFMKIYDELKNIDHIFSPKTNEKDKFNACLHIQTLDTFMLFEKDGYKISEDFIRDLPSKKESLSILKYIVETLSKEMIIELLHTFIIFETTQEKDYYLPHLQLLKHKIDKDKLVESSYVLSYIFN